jgi:prevent-host-death family protein
MKVIPLSEAKAKLSHYGRLCQEEPIIVTVNGVPSFQLAPLEDDDLIDRLLTHNPEFRRMLEMRAEEPTVSLKEALERL